MFVRWCFLAIRYIIRAVSLQKALKFGRLLGYIWYYLIPIRRDLVKSQLKEFMGEKLSDKEISKATKDVFLNLGMNTMEILRLDPKNSAAIVNSVKRVDFDNFEKAAAKGKGVLVLTAHFGNWDLLCSSQALSGVPITILSKTLKPEWLNKYWMDTRGACGVDILPDRNVKQQLLETLEMGKVIGFVIDQHMPKPHGIHVEFMGKKAWTTPGLAELAIESDAPVVPIFIYREGDGHRMEVGEEIPIEQGASHEETLYLTTKRYNEALEEAIKKSPSEWLWLHRRWKNPE